MKFKLVDGEGNDLGYECVECKEHSNGPSLEDHLCPNCRYKAIPQDKKESALKMLREELTEQDAIRAAIKENPGEWYVPHHHLWGMGVRNLLRQKGFDEPYWPIWNLDDIYVPLVEEALK